MEVEEGVGLLLLRASMVPGLVRGVRCWYVNLKVFAPAAFSGVAACALQRWCFAVAVAMDLLQVGGVSQCCTFQAHSHGGWRSEDDEDGAGS
ncbi:hypothetical protein DEO72_LG11g1825 [Vigna unguiculata]|uniref:Uncharacterized protein n=1 Tax=Vigna unguiculata TaxID=3917 RepID=A0A4D6NQM4_VIGUN|nr:hypothetical protein DEO72_LG11g1825 [Vigna unguiculata]